MVRGRFGRKVVLFMALRNMSIFQTPLLKSAFNVLIIKWNWQDNGILHYIISNKRDSISKSRMRTAGNQKNNRNKNNRIFIKNDITICWNIFKNSLHVRKVSKIAKLFIFLLEVHFWILNIIFSLSVVGHQPSAICILVVQNPQTKLWSNRNIRTSVRLSSFLFYYFIANGSCSLVFNIYIIYWSETELIVSQHVAWSLK